jgi:hypothetical protein
MSVRSLPFQLVPVFSPFNDGENFPQRSENLFPMEARFVRGLDVTIQWIWSVFGISLKDESVERMFMESLVSLKVELAQAS